MSELSINPDDDVLVVMPAHQDDVFPETYREIIKAQFEAAGFRRVVVLARSASFGRLGGAEDSSRVKFVVNVPENRLGYSEAMNVARTVRDMVALVESGA